jgi:uncharacterized protein (TIGR03435 family)
MGGSVAGAQGAANPTRDDKAVTNGAPGDAGVSCAAYDVVSVKPSHPERLLMVGARELPDGISGENTTVAMLVQSAYGSAAAFPLEDAVMGLPDWTKSDYFSVEAKMSPEQVAAFKTLDKDHQKACRQTMLQALLADRFKMQVHHLSRQVLGYDLVVGKGGPLFQQTAGPDPNAPKGMDGTRITGSYMRMGSGKNGTLDLTVHGYTMEQVANTLTRSNLGVNHHVTDKTGLTGKYSFTLNFTPTQGVGPAGVTAEASDPAPTIFQALEDQLGLKLQRAMETVDTIVVDHVERPAAN